MTERNQKPRPHTPHPRDTSGRYIATKVIERNRMPNNALYEQDFYAWTQTTAGLVRAGQWREIDRNALAEEVESLGKSEKREISSHLKTMLEHLLKLGITALYLPNDYSRGERGWRATVKEQRLEFAQGIRDTPSLRPTIPAILIDAYEVARLRVVSSLNIEESMIPEKCPWGQEHILHPDFWPKSIP